MSDRTPSKLNACLLGLSLTALVLLYAYLTRSGPAAAMPNQPDPVGIGGSFPPFAMLPLLELQLIELGVWLVAGLMGLELLSLSLPPAWRPRGPVVGLCQVILVLGALADAELVTRIAVWPARSLGIMAPDATRYWTFNRYTTHPMFTVNSHGLRGLEIDPDKRPGEFRILCLGNSVSAGDNLAEKDSYPFLLQGYLRKRCPGVLVRVMNGAVYGYSAVQGRMVLEDVAEEFKPDLVIVCFGRFEPSMVDESGEPLPAHRWPLANLRTAAFRSMLYLTLRQSLESRLQRDALTDPSSDWLVDQAQIMESSHSRQEIMARRGEIEKRDRALQGPLGSRAFWWFVGESRKRGFKLVLYRNFNLGAPADDRLLLARALELRSRLRQGPPLTGSELEILSEMELAFIAGVPVVNLNRAWRRIPNIRDYMQDESHPNVAGTIMQAADIGRFLLDQGLIPGAGPGGARPGPQE